MKLRTGFVSNSSSSSFAIPVSRVLVTEANDYCPKTNEALRWSATRHHQWRIEKTGKVRFHVFSGECGDEGCFALETDSRYRWLYVDTSKMGV